MHREAKFIFYESFVLLVSLLFVGVVVRAGDISNCPDHIRGDILPWLVEMEIRTGAAGRVFMGVLISVRSVISCCSCTASLNPKVESMDRYINAELETISAKTVDNFKTYQIRYVQQVIGESLVCGGFNKTEARYRGLYDDDDDDDEDGMFVEGHRKAMFLRYVSICILDLAFFWNQSFGFPRMPYPPHPETVGLEVREVIAHPDKIICWTQTQIYKHNGSPHNDREVTTNLVWYNVTFFPGQHEVSMLLEGYALKTAETFKNNTRLVPGSPLICEDMTVGILTTSVINEKTNITMKFINLELAYAFITEFDMLYRYFPASSPRLLPTSLLALSLAIPLFLHWFWFVLQNSNMIVL